MTMFNREEPDLLDRKLQKISDCNLRCHGQSRTPLRSCSRTHTLDVYQPRTAGFGRDGFARCAERLHSTEKRLTKQASIIDTQTEYGDLLVIEATGLTDIATGGAMFTTRAQMRGVMGELTNGSLRDIDEIASL